MKSFFKFLSEARKTTASERAHKLGLEGDGKGNWVDKSGKIVARTEGGKLVFRQGAGRTAADQEVSTQQRGSQVDEPSATTGTPQETTPTSKGSETITLVFGRFNPPTVGHQKLLDASRTAAGEGDLRIYPSRSVDPKKNPLEPDDKVELMEAMNHPGKPEMGNREIPFSKELWIEKNDFMEDAPKKFFRLKPDGEVRLRFGYIIRCNKVIKDKNGEVIELHCTYDPDTRSGENKSDRKVKGTIHWVSSKHSIEASVRLYDRLFTEINPNSADDFRTILNDKSLEIVSAKLEPSLANLEIDSAVQFERLGYFCVDREADSAHTRVFNRIVTLRDTWAKIEKLAMQDQENAFTFK